MHRRLSAIERSSTPGRAPTRGSRRSGRSRCSSPRSRGRTTRGRGSAGRTTFTPADVEAVRDRQRELRVPQHFAWVHEIAPTLRGAMPLPVIEVPLLVLEAPTGPPERPVRLLDADDPALRAALAVEQVGFSAPGTGLGPPGRRRARRGAGGRRDADRDPRAPAGGHERHRGGRGRRPARSPSARCARSTAWPRSSPSPRCPAAPPPGHGAAVTAALVEHAVGRGIETVFLSAADDDVARVYERLGFRRAATACFVQ